MKKIPSVFKRNYETNRLCRNEVVEGSEWVLNGEGVATLKYDGTACLIKDGKLFKRYDAKNGKTPPAGFLPAQDPDPVTGHWPGWLEVSEDKPEDVHHREAHRHGPKVDGTYELIGPKVQRNLYNLDHHFLVRHGLMTLMVERTYEEIQKYLTDHEVEGIVFHHPDGRMAKVKRRDFGLTWPTTKGDAK